MTVVAGVRRVATYERVSSEDQRERETIKTQTDVLDRWLQREPDVRLVERYRDDGVSGTIPLQDRPAGGRLLRDAAAGLFDELWVYKTDRLGRDAPDTILARRRLTKLGVRLLSSSEGEQSAIAFDLLTVVDDHARIAFLRTTAGGMLRAAREGRYTGGIVPFGYRAEGAEQCARLVPDESTVWADKSAADLVRDIYERLARKGQSCRMIARDFNALGIPTHYARDGRGIRGKATQGLWRSGRIRNLVVNPVYRGELQYGRRIDQRGAKTERVGHEIISAAGSRGFRLPHHLSPRRTSGGRPNSWPIWSSLPKPRRSRSSKRATARSASPMPGCGRSSVPPPYRCLTHRHHDTIVTGTSAGRRAARRDGSTTDRHCLPTLANASPLW